MRIKLHVGPHKTGTTSIQRYLLDNYGAINPHAELWYPAPNVDGPGHARLAYGLLKGSMELADIVKMAGSADVRCLILSSEEFSLIDEKAARCFVEAVGSYQVDLIVTLSSVLRRIASMWQERIKHGFYDKLGESLDRILERPGLNPNFVSHLSELINPNSVSIVISHSRDPRHRLLINALSAFGLPVPENMESLEIGENKGLGLIETDILAYVNKVLYQNKKTIDKQDRRRLRGLINSTIESREWKNSCPQIGVEVPAKYILIPSKVKPHKL